MEKGFIIYFVGNLIIATVALLLYRHHMKREKEEHKRERQREERCICDSCGHLIQKTVDDSGTAHRICDSREFILENKAVEICTRYERRNDIGARGGLCCVTQENQPCGSQTCPDYNRKKETEVVGESDLKNMLTDSVQKRNAIIAAQEGEALMNMVIRSAFAVIKECHKEYWEYRQEEGNRTFWNQVDGVLAMVEELEKRMGEDRE